MAKTNAKVPKRRRTYTYKRLPPPVFSFRPGPPPRPDRRVPRARVALPSPVADAWRTIIARVIETGEVARIEPRPPCKVNVDVLAFAWRHRDLTPRHRIRTQTTKDGATLVWAEPLCREDEGR